MGYKEIKKLVELIKDTDITEIAVEKDGEKIKIKREKLPLSVQSVPVVNPTPAPAAVPAEPEKKLAASEKGVTIKSPIVGIFHRAPSPESPPFVEVGSSVTTGQVLCIVEAMKLMNEIESDINGTITKIYIENGQPVEYGEPLFMIEPA